tara:strand:- start:3799 stop:4146 length:348 start_codon:yes stop_codon:yes gene_type:complete
MGSEVIILPLIFGSIFGVFYLHYSTRNRERMALIEKGADASIFVKGKRENASPVWKIFILNFALLLIGIGLAIFIASILVYNMNMSEEVAYPATIFLMAGLGLLAGFFVTKKLEN